MVPLSQPRPAARSARPGRAARALALALLGVSAFAVSPAAAATFGVDLYGLSRHFDRHSREGAPFNEVNVGTGINCVLLRNRRQTVFADVAIYRDSFRNANRYVSIAWTHTLIGGLQGGAMLAVSSSRSANLGEPFMAPVPMLSWRTDRAAMQLVYLPPSTELSTYPSVAVFATGYPFGAARATPRAPAPDAAGSGLGIEFSTGRLLTLDRVGDAEIALRRRHGARGWRLGVDLGALIASSQVDTLEATHVSSYQSSEAYDLRLRAERTFHGPVRHGASLLAGVGPVLGYTNDDPFTRLRTWRVGATGSLGVEWRLGSAVSVLAETGWDLTATVGRGEFGTPARWTEVHYERYSLASRAARVGITGWPRGAP